MPGRQCSVVHNHPSDWVACSEHFNVLEGSDLAALIKRHNAACGLLDCGDVLLPLVLPLLHQQLECLIVRRGQPAVTDFPAFQHWLEERKILNELLVVEPLGEWAPPDVWLVVFKNAFCRNKWMNFVLPVGQWAVGHLCLPKD